MLESSAPLDGSSQPPVSSCLPTITGGVGAAVEDLLELAFDQRPLLFDDDDPPEPLGEVADRHRVDRPGAGELQEANAEIGGPLLVDAEVVERLEHVEIALARGDDADPRPPPAVEDEFVRRVGAQKRQRRRNLLLVQPLFLGERTVLRPDVEAARRHPEVRRDDGRHTVERAVDRRRRFDRVLDAFEADPEAGETRERETEMAVVDDLLHAGRRQDRDHRVDEGEFRLVRRRRGFAGVVVAHQRQDAAPRRGAGEIGVLQRIARPVDPRPLAVPDAEDAVVAALAAHLRLLRAPDARSPRGLR